MHNKTHSVFFPSCCFLCRYGAGPCEGFSSSIAARLAAELAARLAARLAPQLAAEPAAASKASAEPVAAGTPQAIGLAKGHQPTGTKAGAQG